jgi:hypothetical protein
MEFKDEDELWTYIESKYDDDTRMIILDLQSYYEILYCNNYVYSSDIERYNNGKLKDTTGELDILAKKYIELIKPQLDKNLNRK